VRSMFLTRLAWAVATVVIVSFGIFVLLDLGGGDVARTIAGENATQEQVQAVEAELGLDRSLPVRYAEWVVDAVTGDLRSSLVTGESVTGLLGRTLPVTLSLVLVALTFSVVIALAAGLLAASRQGSVLDRVISAFASAGVAIPSFLLALVLVRELAVERSFFPAIGYVPFSESPGDWLYHLVLPALALSGITVGEMTRHLRSSLIDVLHQDYILTAHAKGMKRSVILCKHALRNAGIPVVTVLGIRFSQLLGATVIVEFIFVIRGSGAVLVTATQNGDVNVVLGIAVVATVLVVLANLLVDATYGFLNPKLRRS
jgi:peptide/nickel transport system permease protein